MSGCAATPRALAVFHSLFKVRAETASKRVAAPQYAPSQARGRGVLSPSTPSHPAAALHTTPHSSRRLAIRRCNPLHQNIGVAGAGLQKVVGHARGKVGHLAEMLWPRLEDREVDDGLDVDGEDGCVLGAEGEGQANGEERGSSVTEAHNEREEKGRTAGRGEVRRALPATLPQR